MSRAEATKILTRTAFVTAVGVYAYSHFMHAPLWGCVLLVALILVLDGVIFSVKMLGLLMAGVVAIGEHLTEQANKPPAPQVTIEGLADALQHYWHIVAREHAARQSARDN